MIYVFNGGCRSRRAACCAHACAAVNDRQTLESLSEWIGELGKAGESVGLIVGNQTDKGAAARQVPAAEAAHFAAERGMEYMECCALAGEGVSEVLHRVVMLVKQTLPEPLEPAAVMKRGIKFGPLLLKDTAFHTDLYASVMDQLSPLLMRN